MRHVTAAILMIALAACSDDDDPVSPPRFPPVTGMYKIEATFSGLALSAASGSGTITFTQRSRQASELGGTASVTLRFAALSSTDSTITGLRDATVAEVGAIRFQVGDDFLGFFSGWIFDGVLSGNGATMSGTHMLTGLTSDGLEIFSGSWTATRQ